MATTLIKVSNFEGCFFFGSVFLSSLYYYKLRYFNILSIFTHVDACRNTQHFYLSSIQFS